MLWAGIDPAPTAFLVSKKYLKISGHLFFFFLITDTDQINF